jgi:hypothetical protein
VEHFNKYEIDEILRDWHRVLIPGGIVRISVPDMDGLVDLYGTDKNNMMKDKSNEFKYPCVYTITKGEKINLQWSDTNKNGHFNLPKVIWSNGSATSPIVDEIGEYGLTQFSYAIIDDVENLNDIKKALSNPYFIRHIMLFKKLADIYNYKVISTFRKDFWKEFVDYGEDYLKSKVENKNILKTYEKLEEKLLSLNEVETDTKKYYKNFAKGKNIFIYSYFLKGHIHINIKRGDIKQDGSKSKGFFTLNDPKNICVDAEYTIKKNGVNGKYHRIVIDETTDIDYVYSLILQKYYTL